MYLYKVILDNKTMKLMWYFLFPVSLFYLFIWFSSDLLNILIWENLVGFFLLKKRNAVLFLPSVLWYSFFPLIIGDCICAQSHVSHYDGKYQKELFNEKTESNTLSCLYSFYYVQLLLLLATPSWFSLGMAGIYTLIFKHLVNLHGHSN